MKCRTAKSWLMRSLDVPLDPERKELLDAHLAACRVCRAFRSRVELVRSGLASGPAPEPLPFFYERLRARIDERLKPESVPVWVRWSVRAVPVSLLLIGFFVGAILFLSPAVDEEMSQPEALLFQNTYPLSEAGTLFDDKTENKSLNIIFAVNEASSVRRYGP